MRRTLLILAAVCWQSIASAQPRQPIAAEIEAARKRLPTIDMRDVERAERALGGTPSPRAPEVPATPTVDLEALARRFTDATSQRQQGFPDQPSLMVFVSLGMPRETLHRIADQALRAKATLVMRGLQGRSMMKTLEAVAQVIGERQLAWQIDPRLFREFGVASVPAYALLKAGVQPVQGCQVGQCLGTGQWAVVEGDVSMAYALRTMVDRREAFKTDARVFLSRLGE